MKEQVKSRMEVLLQQEITARQLSTTTAPQRPPQPVSRTGQSSLAASTTSQTSTTTQRDSMTSSTTVMGGRGTRVGAKADLVFNVDSGI